MSWFRVCIWAGDRLAWMHTLPAADAVAAKQAALVVVAEGGGLRQALQVAGPPAVTAELLDDPAELFVKSLGLVGDTFRGEAWMPQYLVRTLATIERMYEVEAEHEKAAIAATVTMTPNTEELIEEETTGVYLDGIKVFDPGA